MNKEIINYLEIITQNLNINKKENLNKIYLQITSQDSVWNVNLGTLEENTNSENNVDNLTIKMEESTFFELRDNVKHPEDLMFDEKIKIKGNLDLLK
ncbi:MAG: SCP2 sterol-binding domain-containing protein [Candidatus Actinomarina sp.]|nr:SCP2 sterol-binding domain-containing protein [Candidatus Actinomarina sp.]